MTAAAPTAVRRQPRVLVADDAAAIRALFEKLLTGDGYQVISAVDTQSTEVLVVKAKKKKGAAPMGPLPAGQKTVPGEVKDWELRSGSATKASVIVESTGSGQPGDIHIQTAYPVVG